ncbi:MAG: hypothetical protein IJW00_06560 [Clostridia bacterium]|nr:hypothetical protein [Clostridia bacterium]
MYGYIKAYAPELKVREQEYYRAVYCGLCRTMGKCTGQCSRLTLSCDVTFLALLRLLLEEKRVTVVPRRCVLHPVKKRLIAEPDTAIDYAAHASALLTYHKILDDKQDEQGIKRMKAALAFPYVKRLRKRVTKQGLQVLDKRIGKHMKALGILERERERSADHPAELFGLVMAELISFGLPEKKARIAREMGRHLGRWIYFTDAIDDYEEDKARGRYNPFLNLWQEGEITDSRREDLKNALMSELVAVEAALDLCDDGGNETRDLSGVIRNILYLGMPAAAERVLAPRNEKEQRIKQKKGK